MAKKIKIQIKADELRKKLNIKDGVDGEDGKQGKDGISPVVDTARMTAEAQNGAINALLPLIPTIAQIEQDLPKLGNTFRDGLELLQGEERLDASAVKGLPELQNVVRNAPTGYGGLNLYVKGVKIGQNKTIDFEGMTYSKGDDGLVKLTPDAVSENYLTKITAADTTANYLVNKVLAGTGITVTKENAGGNEDLKIALDKTTTDTYYLKLDQTTPQTITNGIPLLTGLTPTTDYQIATKKYVDDAISPENLWDRTGTTLSTHNVGDDVELDNTSTGLKFYNTVDKTTNYERVRMNFSSNTFFIQNEKGGSGTIRGLSFLGNNTYLTIGSDAGFSSSQTVVVRRDSTTATHLFAVSSTQLTSTNTIQNSITIAPKTNQTGTAGYRGLFISPWLSVVGSSGALLIDAGTNTALNAGGTHTSVFKVDNSGNTTIIGTLGAGAITGTSIIKSGGTSAQFLKADGSVDSSTYLTSTALTPTYVGYGSAGNVLTGDSSFTYNATTDLLTVQKSVTISGGTAVTDGFTLTGKIAQTKIDASAGTGSGITMGTGSSGPDDGDSSYSGGNFTISTGNGGTSTTQTIPAGSAGYFGFIGGTGGVGSGSSPSCGAGGSATFQGGSGGQSATAGVLSGNGGGVTFTGGLGGSFNSTVTGTTTAGNGGGGSFTGGGGNAAQGGSTTNTGGKGGGFNFTAGIGGQGGFVGRGTTNTGGAGGGLTFTGASGGLGTGGSVANNGGAGSTLTFIAGLGGAGATLAGANGNIIFKSGSTEIGRFDCTAGSVGVFKTLSGRIHKVTAVTDTYNVLTTDEVITCSKATDFTITLPTAVVGQTFYIKNIGVGIVTIDGTSTDTIDGDLTQTLNSYEGYTLICNVANSWVAF